MERETITVSKEEFSDRFDKATVSYFKKCNYRKKTMFALSLITSHAKSRTIVNYFEKEEKVTIDRIEYAGFLMPINNDAVYQKLSKYSQQEKFFLLQIAANMTYEILNIIFESNLSENAYVKSKIAKKGETHEE